MNVSEQIKERLKSVMLSDRSNDAPVALKVLHSDLTMLLENYFSLNIQGVNLKLIKDEHSYTLCVEAKIDRILDVGSIIE